LKQVILNLKNEHYLESYQVYERENPSNALMVQSTPYDKPRVGSNDFRIIGNGVMDTKDGKSHLPFDGVQIYKVYRNVNSHNGEGLVICVKMDHHPDGYQVGNKTFVGWVSFHVDGTELLTVNLNTLDLYDRDLNVNNSLSLTNISYTGIQSNSEYIKNLVKVFRSDSGATYRIVTIKGYLDFFCIRFPNIKNNPTMVYLNSNFLSWDDQFNDVDGTYFRRSFILVDGFQDY
jgi:hypothetical protein